MRNVNDGLGCGAGQGGRRCGRCDRGLKVQVRGVCGLPVVVEDSQHRGLLFDRRLQRVGKLHRVGTDQVVEGIPVGLVLGEQPGPGEFADERRRVAGWNTGEARRRG